MEEININNNYSLENISLNSNTKNNDFKTLNYNSIFNFKNSINSTNNNNNNININNNNDNNLNFVPKLRPSKNNSKLKKFKLCIKDFGISNYKCDRVTIDFVNEYETDRIDCLSCPENDDEEYEKCDTQQNSEGNNNEKFDFSEIRKEMKSFKKIIHFDNNYNEAENVLFFENNIIYENNNNCFNNNNNNENNKINEKKENINNNKNKIEEFDLISQLIKQEIEERNKKIKSFKIPYKRMIDLKLNNENNLNKYNYNRKKTIDKKFLNEFNKKKKNISIFNIIKKVNNFRKLEKNKN